MNYIWRQFFSRGIVEPPDQFDLARLDPGAPPATGWEIQPSHPHLLDWLADGFRESGFDLKWLMREITTSQTYQLSSRYDGVFNPLYDRYFVRHQVKRLTAEQVHDAIMLASGRYSSYSVSRTFRGVQFAMKFPDVTGGSPRPRTGGERSNAAASFHAGRPRGNSAKRRREPSAGIEPDEQSVRAEKIVDERVHGNLGTIAGAFRRRSGHQPVLERDEQAPNRRRSAVRRRIPTARQSRA